MELTVTHRFTDPSPLVASNCVDIIDFIKDCDQVVLLVDIFVFVDHAKDIDRGNSDVKNSLTVKFHVSSMLVEPGNLVLLSKCTHMIDKDFQVLLLLKITEFIEDREVIPKNMGWMWAGKILSLA
mmetsp:Transcript_31146/g.50877  ORF Transcript_31146/g.50877 Transcript_31146/m.50877 type:complete len:125 (+) Transcript_31146:894-1268(+)